MATTLIYQGSSKCWTPRCGDSPGAAPLVTVHPFQNSTCPIPAWGSWVFAVFQSRGGKGGQGFEAGDSNDTGR